jgi:tyrosyl-tRNA synthetase
VTTASGAKFGKSEQGAVWLDAAKTSPYRFYQYWVNADDRDTGRFLRYFTLLPREAIEALERTMAAHPERREAQRELAREVTTRVHGEAAARVAAEVSGLLFGGGDPARLSGEALDALRAEVPCAEVAGGDGAALDLIAMLVAAGLAASKGAARRLLEQGGVSVNGVRIPADQKTVERRWLLAGGHLLLKKGARDWAVVRVTG